MPACRVSHSKDFKWTYVVGHQWNLMKILLALIIILLSQSGHKFVHAIPAVYILLQDYKGLVPSRWQTIIWTNSCCFLVGQMAYVEEVVFLLILSRCPHPCNSNEHAIVLLFRLGHAIQFQYELAPSILNSNGLQRPKIRHNVVQLCRSSHLNRFIATLCLSHSDLETSNINTGIITEWVERFYKILSSFTLLIVCRKHDFSTFFPEKVAMCFIWFTS